MSSGRPIRDPLVPGAILLGFALVALAVYLGLRHGPAPGRSAQEVASAAPEPPTSAIPSPSSSVLSGDVVERNVRAALEAEKTAVFVPRCWTPIVAKGGVPHAAYSVQLAFDPNGREIARGISEERGGTGSRSDVAECLRRIPMGLAIPPAGGPVQISVPLAFP